MIRQQQNNRSSHAPSFNVFTLQSKKTPLHLAAGEGRLEVCKILLDLKADTNALDDVSVREHQNLASS